MEEDRTSIFVDDEDIASDEDLDKLDWDRFPSFDPFSEEESIARIDRFEERQAKGDVKWYTSEEVDKMLYEEFPWLKTARTEESQGLD
jgi:hypothetical protein